jgi:hypothetical protein
MTRELKTITIRELKIIHAIADRAVVFYQNHDMIDAEDANHAYSTIIGEILLVHTEIVPLQLDEMLNGRDGDFIHDISGIHRHLITGERSQLSECFLPRFARSLDCCSYHRGGGSITNSCGGDLPTKEN